MAQSIQPNNGWVKSYKLPYKLEEENTNSEIDNGLRACLNLTNDGLNAIFNKGFQRLGILF